MSDARETVVEVDGHRLTFSNLDKVLYPETGFTKGELIAYYHEIAPILLPHLAGRPVSVQRFPDGVNGGRFFQKNVPNGAPSWLDSVVVKSGARRGEETRYPLVDSTAGLLYLANLAAIEVHVPMWRCEKGEPTQRPDEIVFDLDPGVPAALSECCAVALELRSQLADHKLEAFPKTSGKKGMQLYCPVAPMEAEAARALALSIAEEFVAAHPGAAVANMRKDLRKGKVFIDWSQNVPAKTTVAPYSLRPEPEPSISTPLTWEEVASGTTAAGAAKLRFGPPEVLARVATQGDLMRRLVEKR